MSFQTTFDLSRMSTPATESRDGPTRSDSPDGQMTERSGQPLCPASLSARQAHAAGLQTSGTYGPPGTGSSRSQDLAWSLGSRLKARTAGAGSTLFRLTWKGSATPAGRSFFLLRGRAWPIQSWLDKRWRALKEKPGASYWPEIEEVPKRLRLQFLGSRALAMALRTSGTGFGSWPTPNSGPQNDGDTTWRERRALLKEKHGNGNGFGLTLGQAASLAPWPTATVHDAERGGQAKRAAGPERHGSNLQDFALLATGWATPRAEDSESTGAHRGTPDTLNSQVILSGWMTPKVSRGKYQRDNGKIVLNLEGQVHLAASGGTPNGSPAATEKRGQLALNPAHSRWLQGFPPIWDRTAPAKIAPSASSAIRKQVEASGKPRGGLECSGVTETQ